jgi:putative redox protein
MVAVREKTLTQMRLHGTCPTHARTHVVARSHEIVIDEPRDRGGTDMAPTPLESMIAALIGCTNVILHKIAAHNGIEIDVISVGAEATLDRRGVTLQEEIPIPFPEIKLTITLSTSADDARLAKLKTDLGRFCAVSKILRQSGTNIEETWLVTRD